MPVGGVREQLRTVENQINLILGYNAGIGRCIYVDPANGDDLNSGYSPNVALKTLTAGYAKATTNNNDVVFLIGNNGSISLSAQLDWAKSYTHLVGVSNVVVGGRARIFQLGTATGIDLLKFSGSGNLIKNIYAFHGVDDATSKICATVTGSRNKFERCHFAGIGHATMSVSGSASLKIDGGSENEFKDCAIGLDTIARDADATEIWLDSAASRNKFEDCHIYGYISAAGYSSVTLEDGQAIDRYLRFKNCLFQTDSVNQSVAQTSVFNIKSAIVQGKIILENSFAMTDGTAEWDSNNRNIIFNNSAAAAASAAGGIMTRQ